MTKTAKILVLVLVITVMLHISPAWACACGGTPNWSVMSAEEIASTINGMKEGPRIRAAEDGDLPAPPRGYKYDNTYKLVPTK